MANWAYDFACDHPLEMLGAAASRAGPWKWEARESFWYGDYLNSRPARGIRMRIHMYPQTVQDGAATLTGLRDKGFMALLQIDPKESSATREEIDQTFRSLLEKLGATQVTAIEPYD